MKPSILLLALAASSTAVAADVPWLAEVTTPPAEVPQPERPLTPLLAGPNGRPLATPAAWEAKRKELREAWLDFLGPLPQPPAAGLVLETVSEERLDRVQRSRVRYEAEPGRFVEASLLRPLGDDSGRRPAVVVFHPTTAETFKVVDGTGGRPDQHVGLRLAERGFVVLCPRNFLWEETE
ncbi:MAG TPA: hypothetical protein VF170_05715, partial [Planctomycetaceae bacterium]